MGVNTMQKVGTLAASALVVMGIATVTAQPAAAQYVYNRGGPAYGRPIPWQQYRSVPMVRVAPAPNPYRVYGNVYAGRALQMMPRNPGMPGVPFVLYQGAKGYSVSGWELGRMQSIRRYGVDPGPWPGWRGALGW